MFGLHKRRRKKDEIAFQDLLNNSSDEKALYKKGVDFLCHFPDALDDNFDMVMNAIHYDKRIIHAAVLRLEQEGRTQKISIIMEPYCEYLAEAYKQFSYHSFKIIEDVKQLREYLEKHLEARVDERRWDVSTLMVYEIVLYSDLYKDFDDKRIEKMISKYEGKYELVYEEPNNIYESINIHAKVSDGKLKVMRSECDYAPDGGVYYREFHFDLENTKKVFAYLSSEGNEPYQTLEGILHSKGRTISFCQLCKERGITYQEIFKV